MAVFSPSADVLHYDSWLPLQLPPVPLSRLPLHPVLTLWRWVIVPVPYSIIQGLTPLMLTAQHKNAGSVFDLLVRAGVNVAAINPQDGASALTYAAEEDNRDLVEALLQMDVPVDAGLGSEKCQGTPLMKAAEAGHVEVAAVLLAHGADMGAYIPKYGTALVRAAKGLKLPMVKALVGANADPNKATEKGGTALFWAARGGYLEMVQALLAAKANPSEDNNQNETVLMRAAEGGYLDLVKALLDANADPLRKSDDGKTALGLAEEGGFSTVAAVLHRACGSEGSGRHEGADEGKADGSEADAGRPVEYGTQQRFPVHEHPMYYLNAKRVLPSGRMFRCNMCRKIRRDVWQCWLCNFSGCVDCCAKGETAESK